jgi:hypothetical protein
MSYCLRPSYYLYVLYWCLATVWGHATILSMAFNQTLMILCKTITFCSVHLNHLTLRQYLSFFRCSFWCSLTQDWSTNPTEVHEEKMTTPDYCCVAPSLMGHTPISRPPAQCLNLTVAIELVKHLSPSEREYCEPLELIVPSSSCMFTLSRLTAIYRDRYTTFIISRFTIR